MRVVRWTVLVMAMVILPLAVNAGPNKGKKGRHHKKPSAVELAIERIEALEERLENGRDLSRQDVQKIRLELKEIRLELKDYALNGKKDGRDCCPCDAVVAVEVPQPVEEVPAEVVPVVEPMTALAYGNLVKALKREGFGDDKLKVLSAAVKDNYFTVEQVKGILGLFSFPDEKLKALRLVQGRIVDTQNQFELLSAFVHSSDKEEAQKILEGN